MGRFEFRSKEITLDFAGLQTTVPGTVEYAEKLKDIGHRMVAWGTEHKDADNEEAKDFMLDILDELLGEEVMDKIEDAQDLDVYDCCDMFKYIKDEVMEYHRSKVEETVKNDVPQPVPMAQVVENRAMRRAKRRSK